MMAANYRHIGGGENRLGRHYSRFAGIWPTSFLADQSLTLRKSQNAGSNRPSRVGAGGMKRFVEGEDRRQVVLLPHCLDDYVTENNPVRVIERSSTNWIWRHWASMV